LQRLLRDYADYTFDFLAEPTFLTVVDTYGIELIHPRREGRSAQQIGKKGKSNGRWIVGVKLAWLITDRGGAIGPICRPMKQTTPFDRWLPTMMVRQLRCLTWGFAKQMRRSTISSIVSMARGMSALRSKPI
jgi:hypothetical protein